MRIFSEYLENLNGRRGLYCVWVPAPPGSATPLLARWIDPQAESQVEQHHEEHETAEATERQEADVPWLRLTLKVA
jgi:hypothetical protein